ncbi:uncharacterized protein DUF4296 [Sunxiuqinia elliptica]|nr:uncharacterized protein DUF4296 [Sunxiuqinia elliptica]
MIIVKRMQTRKTTSYILLLFFIFFGFSCKEKKGFSKPNNLIKEKQMVNMLYDIHLGEAYANQYRFQDEMDKIKSKDMYYSVLEKYEVADSVFAQSIVYYSSMPKIYERIYQQVVDRLNMLQEENNQKEEVKIKPEE